MSKRLLTAADRPRLQASRLGARCRSAQSHVFLFRCEYVLVPDESCAREGLLPQQRDRAAADPDERHIATVALANGHIDFSLNISPVLKHCALIDEHKRDSVPRLLVSSSVINPSHSAQAPRTNHSTRVRTSRDEGAIIIYNRSSSDLSSNQRRYADAHTRSTGQRLISFAVSLCFQGIESHGEVRL